MIAQLPLVGMPAGFRRGDPLLAVRIPVEPRPYLRERARAIPVWIGPKRQWKGTTYPHPDYDGYLDAIVTTFEGWTDEPVATWVAASVVSVFERPPLDSWPKHVTITKKVADGTKRTLRIPVPPPDGPGRQFAYAVPDDEDNLVKAILDGLVRARVLWDDRLVVRLTACDRLFGAEGEQPCTEVRLWRA